MKRFLFALPVLAVPACIQYIDVGWNDQPTGGTTSSSGGAGGTVGSGGTGGASLCMPGATAACYGGPPGTEGQGICKAGAQTCAADGASWGPCVGEVLPQPENCATPQDEDCDGEAPPCNGALLWAKRFGDAGDQSAQSIAVDPAGNILVTGGFNGTVDFGGGPLTSMGGSDAFVVKLDPAGNCLWSRSFGDAQVQAGQGVAVDTAGNVLVTGFFSGTVDFGGGPLSSTGVQDINIFVVKLDPSGAHLWSRSFGDAQPQAGQGISIDASGSVIMTGYFNGTVDFGGGVLTSAGIADVFVAKLDAAGAHQWSRRFGDGQEQAGRGVTVDASGSVIVTGYMGGAVDFGGGLLTSTGGSRDIFVVKLGADGAHQWSRHFGDGDAQAGQSVAVDSSGNVLVTGDFFGNLDFGDGALPSSGSRDIFVAKLDTTGAYLWAKRFGDAQEQGGRGIAVDASGNVLVTGYFNGTVDFGGGPLVSAGGTQYGDAFVAKLDWNGGHLWSKRFGDPQDQAGQSVAVDSAGNVLAAGYINGTVPFGDGVTLGSAGGWDVFIAKFSP